MKYRLRKVGADWVGSIENGETGDRLVVIDTKTSKKRETIEKWLEDKRKEG